MGLFGKKKADRASRAPSIVVIRLNGVDDLWGKFTFPLGPGQDIIGRDESCSIQLADPQISREHCAIEFHLEAGGFVARDLGSVNGTLINDQALSGSTVLSEGDIIEVGDSRLLFTSEKVEGQVPAIHFKRRGEHQVGTLAGDAKA